MASWFIHISVQSIGNLCVGVMAVDSLELLLVTTMMMMGIDISLFQSRFFSTRLLYIFNQKVLGLFKEALTNLK